MSIHGYTLSSRAAAAERRSRGAVTLRAVPAAAPRTANDDERVTADEPTGGMRISESVKLAARYGARLTATPSQTFSVCQAAPGVLPSNMTMDSVVGPDVGALTAWAIQGQFHEGLAFPGFPYLAELAQRTEYRHIASIYAEHATRKAWKLHGPDERVKALETFLGEGDGGIGAVSVFREAIEHDGLSGRAQVFLDFDDADDDAELAVPLLLKPEKIGKNRPLKRLKVVEAMWSYPGGYGTSNPLRQDWYKPSVWYVNAKQVHDTRMLTIVGHEVPDILKPAYAFAGLSRTQMAKAYCDNWLRTRQSVSDMTSAYSHLVLSTSLGETLQGGVGPAATGVFDRVDMMNMTRDNRGAWVIDKDTETLTNVAVPLSGLDKLQAQSQEQLAAAARIPLSIYLQITPNGLNASSENEIRSFYADIKGYQEKTIRKPLQYLLDVAQLSLFGSIDATVGFEFLDLWETSALDQSTIDKNEAETDQVLVTIGAFSNEEVRQRHVTDEHSPYFKVTGPAPELPEPEPTKGAQDGWNEADHPRAENGQFGEGSAYLSTIKQHFRWPERGMGPKGYAKRLREKGVEVSASDPSFILSVEKFIKDDDEENKKRHQERVSSPEYIESLRQKESEEQKKVEKFSESPTWPAINGNKKNEIKTLAKLGMEDHAEDVMKLAVIEVMAAKLIKDGFTERHISKSKSGRNSSRYLKAPGGEEVRLSDHEIPVTAERESRGGPRWQDVIPEDWRTRDINSYIDEVRKRSLGTWHDEES